MSRCYVFNALVNSGSFAEEHVFLNAIGGRLKSSRLPIVEPRLQKYFPGSKPVVY